MAEVAPFKGVLYNVPRLSRVLGEDLLAPPYDIITPELKEELYGKSPYNIVRIDFGKELSGDDAVENRYSRAKAFFDAWLQEGVFIKSKTPCFYSYEISYTINGMGKNLKGFLGMVRLEELGKGSIHPHECTHSKPKKDRLDLMRICSANISPIFSLYSSKGSRVPSLLAEVNRSAPYIDARDNDGASHRLREISDSSLIEVIKAELSGQSIFIADGHHRYETALEYQREMRELEGNPEGPRPYDYVLMFLADIHDEGLTILPTHRLVRNLPTDALGRLSDFFVVEKVSSFDIPAILSGKSHVLGYYDGDSDGWYVVSYKGGYESEVPPVLSELDVSLLHDLIFGRLLKGVEVTYEMDIQKCLNLVRENKFEAVFFLNPTLVEEVEKVAMSDLRMPPKSTYFYPKLLTGMVINSFKN